MKRLALMAVVVAGAAMAGELCKTPDGRPMLLTPRAGSTSNAGGTGDAGFVLGPSVKITVQCRENAGGTASSTICIDETTCTANLGINVTGNQALPTSTSATRRRLADAGYSAIVSAYSAGNDNCLICIRAGNEF